MLEFLDWPERTITSLVLHLKPNGSLRGVEPELALDWALSKLNDHYTSYDCEVVS